MEPTMSKELVRMIALSLASVLLLAAAAFGGF
jgi:hypothetical protein